MPKATFEEKYSEIENIIERRRKSWKLNSIKYVDFDDVKQEILARVWEKWDLWDQERPLANWLNKVITNRIINKVRDYYGYFQKPCVACAKNMGAGLCSYTQSGNQCSECPLYKEWEIKKRPAYEIELASSDAFKETDVVYEEEIDYIAFLEKNSDKIKSRLNSTAYKIYVLLYIEGNTEEQVAEKLKYKPANDNRISGYRQITNYKKKIKTIIKEILELDDYRFSDLHK